MDWKQCKKKGTWPNLRYYPCTCWEELRKNKKELQNNWCTQQDFNHSLTKYQTDALLLHFPEWCISEINTCFLFTHSSNIPILLTVSLHKKYLTIKFNYLYQFNGTITCNQGTLVMWRQHARVTHRLWMYLKHRQ
jgi:hypothetical protein